LSISNLLQQKTQSSTFKTPEFLHQKHIKNTRIFERGAVRPQYEREYGPMAKCLETRQPNSGCAGPAASAFFKNS
jgi:hypothetical protein